MKPAERQQWILDYIEARQKNLSLSVYRVNVCDRYFVDDYVDHTGAKSDMCFYGADRCRQLGRDLTALYKAGKLDRRRDGISGLAGQGFPKWVWAYCLASVTPRG